MKKKRHNGNRGGQGPAPAPPPPVADPPVPPPGAKTDETAFDPVMVEHLRVTTSMIEGRKVTRQEVIEMLTRMTRQHSIAKDPAAGYGGGEPKPPPP